MPTAIAQLWLGDGSMSDGRFEEATVMMEWVETKNREATTDGYFFFLFFPTVSQPRHLVNSNVTLLSDSQLTRSDHGLPQLVNVLAESNLVQT